MVTLVYRRPAIAKTLAIGAYFTILYYILGCLTTILTHATGQTYTRFLKALPVLFLVDIAMLAEVRRMNTKYVVICFLFFASTLMADSLSLATFDVRDDELLLRYCILLVGFGLPFFIRKESRPFIERLLVASALVTSIWIVTTYMADRTFFETNRGAKQIGDANYLASWIALGLVLSLTKVSSSQRAWKVGMALVSLVCAVSLIVVASRGQIIAAAVGVVVLLILSRSRSGAFVIAAILALSVAAMMAGNVVSSDYLVERFSDADTMSTGSGRLDSNRYALQAFEEMGVAQWLVGNGSLSASYIIGKRAGVKRFSSHNIVIETLLDYGVLGILVLFYYYCYIYRCCSSSNERAKKLALFATLVVSSLSIIPQNYIYAWLYLGMLVEEDAC